MIIYLLWQNRFIILNFQKFSAVLSSFGSIPLTQSGRGRGGLNWIPTVCVSQHTGLCSCRHGYMVTWATGVIQMNMMSSLLHNWRKCNHHWFKEKKRDGYWTYAKNATRIMYVVSLMREALIRDEWLSINVSYI